jgi:hypothetical protein
MDYMFVGYFKGNAASTLYMQNKKDLDGNELVEDYDGFAAVRSFSNSRPDGTQNKQKTIRFSSIEMDPPLDDYVHGVCYNPIAKGVTDVVYVVGSTYGTMPSGLKQEQITTNTLSGKTEKNTDGNQIGKLSSWVSKIDVTDQATVLWTTQLYATKDNISFEGGETEALGCHVLDQDATKMYIGGNVYNGGIMDSSEKSAGGDDVWVAQLNTEDGSLRWIRQIGSSGDERLARTNGIESDLNGHAIIFGETTGELYRTRTGEPILADDGTATDIFVTTLDLITGRSESTIESDRNSNVKRNIIMGSVGGVVLMLLCICGGTLMKWRRAKRYAARDADGIVTDKPSFKDMGDGDDAPGETAPVDDSSNSPPSEAFEIS